MYLWRALEVDDFFLPVAETKWCYYGPRSAGPFSPPQTATVFSPLGGRIGGSTPNSTLGIRKTGWPNLETRPFYVFSRFRALFAVLLEVRDLLETSRSHPAHMRPLRAVGCKNGRRGEGNPPDSGAVLRLAESLMGRAIYPPKHGCSEFRVY